MTNQQYNENGRKPKGLTAFYIKLFNYLVKETSMRRRIVGKTDQFCEHEGSYYCEQDPSQITYLRPGETFPFAYIDLPKDSFAVPLSKSATWILRQEDSPRKTWRELGYSLLPIAILLITIALLSLAVSIPWWLL